MRPHTLRWIDVAEVLPDIFTEKEVAGASKTTVSVLRAKNKIICVAKARVMIDVSTLSENGLPRGTPSEPLMFVFESVIYEYLLAIF